MRLQPASILVLGCLGVMFVVQASDSGSTSRAPVEPVVDSEETFPNLSRLTQPLLLAQADGKLPQGANPQVMDDPRLLAIGALGASHVYTTYGYIGIMADGFVEDLNRGGDIQKKQELVQELTLEVVSMCENCQARLEALREIELVPEDIAVVNQMAQIYGLLARQARALNAFVQNQSPRNANEFEDARTTVWPMIAQLLGIDNVEP